MSELVNNLQEIYNIKLQIKDVLGTESDLFSDYPDLIEEAIGEGGGGSDVDLYHHEDLWADVIENEVFNEEITVQSEIYDEASFHKNYENNIITNYTWKNYQYDGNGDLVATVYISVNNPYTDGTDVFQFLPDDGTSANAWPNHYAVLMPILQGVLTPRETAGLYDFEGKILYHDATPTYQVVTITENGFYNAHGGMNVNIPDPLYGRENTSNMIQNGIDTAFYVDSGIDANFEFELISEPNEPEEYAISWDTQAYDSEDNEKIVHVMITADPHEIAQYGQNIWDFIDATGDAYGLIFPILQNATLTASEDPSNDGYDYLLEGELYAWNMVDNYGQMEVMTDNGYVCSSGGVVGYEFDYQGE